jgi:hypothetical protein
MATGTPLTVPVTAFKLPSAVGGGGAAASDPVIHYSNGKWSLLSGKPLPVAMRLYGLDLYASGTVVVGDKGAYCHRL